MQIFSTLLTIGFVIVSALLMLIIMIQSNRSSGMGLFGGSASQSAFGASSGDVLSKITGYLTAIFMVLALSLAYLKSRESSLSGISIQPSGQTQMNTPAANENPEGAATDSPAPESGTPAPAPDSTSK